MDPPRSTTFAAGRNRRPTGLGTPAGAAVTWIAIALALVVLVTSWGSLGRPNLGSGASGVPPHLAGAGSYPHVASRESAQTIPATAASTGAIVAWHNISSETAHDLPVAWFTEGTWDAADGFMMYYGGDNFTGTNLQATLAYRAGNWTTVATTGTSPGPLDGPALAYDVADGYVVMYGGLKSYSPFSYTNLTYVFSGGSWSSSHLNPTPPPRLAASMTYDPDLGGVVLFGGYNNSDPTGGTLLNDLWLYKAGTWSRLPDASPPAVRTWASIAYDPTLQEIVLYGGISASSTCYGDTWTYNGTWTHVTVPSGGPTGLTATALGYDPDLGAPVMTGGTTCAGAASTSTWTFNGSAWNTLSATGTPSAHVYGVAAWDPTEQMFVVAGGNPAGGFTDALSTPLHVTGTTGPSTTAAGASFTFNASLAGGVPLRGFEWAWGDGTISRSQNASHSYPVVGVYSVNLTVTDASGASAFWNGSVDVVAGIAAHITGSPVLTEVGINSSFTGTSTGGSGAVTYAWDFGDGANARGATVVHAYSTAGNFTVTLTATDSADDQAVSVAKVRVFAALTVTMPTVRYADVGVPVRLNSTDSGGDAPWDFAWISDDGATGATSDLRHAFTTPGSHTVQLTVRDALNVSQIATTTVRVATALVLTLHGPTSLSTGDTGSWAASVSGGTPPFRLTWNLPDGANGTGGNTSFEFADAGTFPVSFEVTDAVGAATNATVNVTVSTSPSLLGETVGGIPTVALLGAFLGIVVVAAVVAARRIRQRRGTPPDESP